MTEDPDSWIPELLPDTQVSVVVPEEEEELVGGLYVNVVWNGPRKLILTGLQDIGKPKPFNLIDFCGTIMYVKCLFKEGGWRSRTAGKLSSGLTWRS